MHLIFNSFCSRLWEAANAVGEDDEGHRLALLRGALVEVGVPLPIAPVQDDAVRAGVAPALAQGGDELVVAVSVAQHRAALCSLRDFGRDLIDQHHLSQAHLHAETSERC